MQSMVCAMMTYTMRTNDVIVDYFDVPLVMYVRNPSFFSI